MHLEFAKGHSGVTLGPKGHSGDPLSHLSFKEMAVRDPEAARLMATEKARRLLSKGAKMRFFCNNLVIYINFSKLVSNLLIVLLSKGAKMRFFCNNLVNLY